MNHKLASLTITGSLIGGSLLGATVFSPNVAFGQDDTPATADTAQVEGPTDDDGTAPGARGTDRGVWLDDVLAGLVDDGTITQDQSDALAAAIGEARAAQGPLRHGMGHDRRLGGGGPMPGSEVLTELLGVPKEELSEALRTGDTIAQIATDAGVDIGDVVDALVAEQTDRINQGLEAGRIDAERAEEAISGLAERVEAMVNGERIGRGHLPGPR